MTNGEIEANCSAEIIDATGTILADSRLRPQCALSDLERASLRKANIKKSEISQFTASDFATLTDLSTERSYEIVGLHSFQTLRSVGVASSEDLWQLGFSSPGQLVGQHPFAMYLAYSTLVGELVDRCVEDVFRCAVAQVEWKSLPIKATDWWAWTRYRGEARLPPRSTF